MDRGDVHLCQKKMEKGKNRFAEKAVFAFQTT